MGDFDAGIGEAGMALNDALRERPRWAAAASRFSDVVPLRVSDDERSVKLSASPSRLSPKKPSQRVPSGNGTGTIIRRGGRAGSAIWPACLASMATKLVY